MNDKKGNFFLENVTKGRNQQQKKFQEKLSSSYTTSADFPLGFFGSGNSVVSKNNNKIQQ